jgi:hypothetical protein
VLSAGQGGAPEVCDFSRIQLSKARHDTLWADQHVAWHYRLQVHCRRGLGPITMCSSTGRTCTGPSQQRTKGKAVLRGGEDLVTVNLPRPKQVLLHYGHRVLMLECLQGMLATLGRCHQQGGHTLKSVLVLVIAAAWMSCLASEERRVRGERRQGWWNWREKYRACCAVRTNPGCIR